VVVQRRADWVFLPALGAAAVHGPVLRYGLLRALERPINRRAFGANKTWRGALAMTAGPLAATIALHRLPAYRRVLPPAVEAASPARVGLLLGLAIWVGELPNSFVKRRLGIPPGGQRRGALGAAISLIDQADWVPTAWLLLAPVWRMRPGEAARAAAWVAAVHVPVNLVGYAWGARTSPL
jgi:hypothetical protein